MGEFNSLSNDFNKSIEELMSGSLEKLFIEDDYKSLYDNLGDNYDYESKIIILFFEVLKKGDDNDFISSVLNNSIQKDIDGGIDLNRIVEFDGEQNCIFFEVLETGNLSKLIELLNINIDFISLLDFGLLEKILKLDCYSNEEKGIVFEHLIVNGLGNILNESHILTLLGSGNTYIIENLYKYDQQEEDYNKRFFTLEMFNGVYRKEEKYLDLINLKNSNKIVKNLFAKFTKNERKKKDDLNSFNKEKNEFENSEEMLGTRLRTSLEQFMNNPKFLGRQIDTFLNDFDSYEDFIIGIAKKIGEIRYKKIINDEKLFSFLRLKTKETVINLLKNNDNILNDDDLIDIINELAVHTLSKLINNNEFKIDLIKKVNKLLSNDYLEDKDIKRFIEGEISSSVSGIILEKITKSPEILDYLDDESIKYIVEGCSTLMIDAIFKRKRD